ncbi:MAG TPA: inositol monophosphatase family protein [Casimicrobiaceae bacterium]|nr:inositol monophosphatase family protein [Casimicrobiaceae bacterium]
MTPADIAARAEVARRLAREAGALAHRYFRREIAFTTESKGPQDFVSAADHAVEALIRERLLREFPSDSVFGEESGGEVGTHVWVVDPIDGTINFVHGVRYWCVSICYIASGERRIGVIYDPSLDELFWSVKGEGAWCDDTLIHVAARDRLDHALVCAGYVPRHPLEAHLALKRRLHEAGAAVKDMGAGALMLAHVAAGRFDAFLEPHMHPWDASAGLLLVAEAGGHIHPYPGPAGLVAGGPVIAAATGIFDALERLALAR